MKDEPTVELTVIVPILNEQENLEELYQRVTQVAEECVSSHEIILIDDGSRDNSFPIMCALHDRDSRVKAVRFSRNFGQHPALSAGYRLARGKMVVCIDGDLQNPPEEIPKLVAKYKEGFEVVYGHRVNRHDPLLRKIGSKVLYRFLEKTSLASSVPKDIPFTATASSFRLLSHNVVQALNRFEERARFLASMTTWLGFKSACVEVRHAPRERGESKYGLLKLILMAIDSITGVTSFPLKLASATGVLLSAIPLLYAAFLIVARLVFGLNSEVEGVVMILCSVAFLGGVQLLFLGILGEYLARVYKEVQGRPLFVVDHVVGNDNENDLERLIRDHPHAKHYAGSYTPEQDHQ